MGHPLAWRRDVGRCRAHFAVKLEVAPAVAAAEAERFPVVAAVPAEVGETAVEQEAAVPDGAVESSLAAVGYWPQVAALA